MVVAGVTSKSAAASPTPSGAGSLSETRFCSVIVHTLLKPPDGVGSALCRTLSAYLHMNHLCAGTMFRDSEKGDNIKSSVEAEHPLSDKEECQGDLLKRSRRHEFSNASAVPLIEPLSPRTSARKNSKESNKGTRRVDCCVDE